MILTFFLNVVSFLLLGLFTVLPNISIIPAGTVALISNLAAYVNGWAWLFPTGTIFSIIAIILIVMFAEFTFHSSIYILNFIVKVTRG